jgi:wyosine [tRNA(Phe)-imidazoG37] synthetase (radical SAM superfamily)
MIAFGPVPSRRLGYSLGINNIPPKHCSYSCVYCQVGRTTSLEIKRRVFFPLEFVLQQVERKITESAKAGRAIDFLTLVPDGEPTLDLNIGRLIIKLKEFGIPVAVISNSSLINLQDVQDDLLGADWVSIKIDSVNEESWRHINRPYHSLSLSSILEGALEFRERYQGELVTETMLVSGNNDNEKDTQDLSDFLIELKPKKSYLSIPTRPPAEAWVRSPDPENLAVVFQIISNRIAFMDLLIEAEDTDFHSTGDLVDDIISTTSVHPIREEALRKMVDQAGAGWGIVETLVADGKIIRIPYRDEWFYAHHFKHE